MKPLFTIHAGEYLTGCFIEQHFKKCRVWVPAKDTGIDLLVTDSTCSRPVTLQVKFSKDFMPTHMGDFYKNKLKVCTWFQFTEEAISRSDADYWVLVMQSHAYAKAQFLVMPPSVLLSRISAYHGVKKKYDLYFWTNAQECCWESRGLVECDRKKITDDTLGMPERDFSEFLNDWKPLEEINI